MTAWHENARFDVFAKCDVFVEDDHFLYVENQAFNYAGAYTCRECRIVAELDGSRTYLWGCYVAADNEYIASLNVATWEIAREIIERELAYWQEREEELDNYRDEEDQNAGLIEDARWCLMHYAEPNKVYTYC